MTRAGENQAGEPARKFGTGWEIIGPEECPLQLRWTIITCRWFKLLLHHFFPNAKDKAPHDHPRSFVTLIVRGGYDDIRPDGSVEVLRAPALRFRRARHAHITAIHPDGATTISHHGPARPRVGLLARRPLVSLAAVRADIRTRVAMRMTRDTTPCPECGEPPLYVIDPRHPDHDPLRVDACFGDKLPYPVISACCGHGGHKPAYVRISTDVPLRPLDICGGVVMPYGEYVDTEFRKVPR